ncbi:DUF4184 family protein [Paenibacillus turpanensis]|uniref:DUF4184 family protein n=1 Tax=Paenibacillus turpanensis TaxID=2689078 RepID=UPI001407B112|nr:DUF4184 family protein [Paenibacillus turpanensis]
MPFTFAHPLYAAPVKRLFPRWISLTGIILGSMSPDFEYFIALEPYQSIGHTTKGLFLQAIPLSILFAFLFHYFIKRPLARNLPSVFGLDRRAYALILPWKIGGLREALVFLTSVTLGFYSHIGIDAFTHQSGGFVTQFPILQQRVLPDLPGYKLLQYSLSIVGLAAEALILLVFLFKSKQPNEHLHSHSSTRKSLYWAVVFAVTFVTVSIKFAFFSSGNQLGMLVVSSISGCSLGLIIAGLIDCVQEKKSS